MDYNEALNKVLPITLHSEGEEDGSMVETYCQEGIVDGKWVEARTEVKKTVADLIEEDGAVYAVVNGFKKLIKCPNVPSFRIGEDVHGLASHCFDSCTGLKQLEIPYTIDDNDIDKATEHLDPNIECKIYNWPYDALEEATKEITDGWTDDYGYIYSKDRKTLLRAARKKREYFIMEGCEKIARTAFLGCRFATVHVPYTCNLDKLEASEYPIFGNDRISGCVVQWHVPYAEQDSETDTLCTTDSEDDVVIKDYVRYSKSGKRLLSAIDGFDADYFEVPNGVETICDFAFSISEKPLVISIPSTVKVIGDYIFGKGDGRIIIRH